MVLSSEMSSLFGESVGWLKSIDESLAGFDQVGLLLIFIFDLFIRGCLRLVVEWADFGGRAYGPLSLNSAAAAKSNGV